MGGEGATLSCRGEGSYTVIRVERELYCHVEGEGATLSCGGATLSCG